MTNKDTKKKTVCRSSNKKAQSASPIDKRPQTLESSRKERFGIGNKSIKVDAEKYGRGKRRRGQIVDYRKLNEGDEGDEQMEFIPAPPRELNIPRFEVDRHPIGRVHKNNLPKALKLLPYLW